MGNRKYLAKGGPATLHGAQVKTEPSNHEFQFGTFIYLQWSLYFNSVSLYPFSFSDS